MGAVEILLGVAFPTLFFTALGLALATVGPIGFLIARASFCLAALDVIALVTWWLYTSESAGWKLAIGIAIGAIIVGGLPDVLRWVDSNEQKVIAQREDTVGRDLVKIAPIVEALRQNQHALDESEQTRNLLGMITAHYDRLQEGISVQEQFTGAKRTEERLAAAEHIIEN